MTTALVVYNGRTYGVLSTGFALAPVTDIIAQIEQDELGTIDPLLDTSSASPVGQLNGIHGEKLAEVWELAQACYNVVNRDNAEGQALDNVGALEGTQRPKPTPSLVTCQCTFGAAGTFVAGSLVAYDSANPSIKWQNSKDVVVSGAGTVTGLQFQSQSTGASAALYAISRGVGHITSMVPVSNWTAIADTTNPTPGTDLADDPTYRALQQQELSAVGSSTADGIRADLLKVPGVITATVYQNTGLLTDSNGVPGKSYLCLVWDGSSPAASNSAIGQVIWNDKGAGMQTYGATSVTVTDSQGNPQTVFFSRPSGRRVYMAVTVSLAPGAVLATVAAAVKAAMVGAAAGSAFVFDGQVITPANPLQTPGALVSAAKYQGVASGVTGVSDVTGLALGFSPSPVGTSSLAVGTFEIATLALGDITVNGI